MNIQGQKCGHLQLILVHVVLVSCYMVYLCRQMYNNYIYHSQNTCM